MKKIKYVKNYTKWVLILFICLGCIPIPNFGIIAFSQNVNPQSISQMRTLLSAKGLNEAEVLDKLKSKGLDVENMTEVDLLKNRVLIEQIIGDMEAEKKSKTQIQENKIVNPSSHIISSVVENPKVSAKGLQSDIISKPVIPSDINLPTDIYGHKIFRDNSLEIYRVSKDASPPETYILASGDKINIIIFGKSQADLQYEINSDGFIKPTNMPKVFLSGLNLKQAKNLLELRFATFYYFNNDQFALTLNSSRTINVNIFGEVERTGSFTTSALNTALNVLSASGGPTDFGTVRYIQIIRGGEKKIFDVYAFMLNPILQFDYYLQNNDIIYVSTAQKIVTLNGAVNRPMRYELTSKEGLEDLLNYAGGLKTNAFTDFIQLQRFENNISVIKDFSLKDILSGKIKLELLNGDVINIKSINSSLRGFVKITGAVEYPGNYEITSTQTVKELLIKSKLKPTAKIDQAYINRKRIDLTNAIIPISITEILTNEIQNIKLEKEDELIIYEQSEFIDQFTISVTGEVRQPFAKYFKVSDTLSIKTAINIAGGIKPNAADFAYIYRTNPLKTKKTEYISINLNDNYFSEMLQPGDKLVVLNKDLFQFERTISITGEVNIPTSLRFDASLSIKDLIKIAGGFSIASNPDFVEILRLEFEIGKEPKRTLIKLDINNVSDASYQTFSLQPFDIVIVRKIYNFRLHEVVQIKGEVYKEGLFEVKTKNFHFSDLINDAGGITQFADIGNCSIIRIEKDTSFLLFDAIDALNNKGVISKDPILFNGDFVIIPKIKNTITIDISGTNYIITEGQKNITITYRENKSAIWYINNYASGFKDNKNKKIITVFSQNGIQRTTIKRFLLRKHPKINPGDKILVSFEMGKLKNEISKKEFDWEKFMNKILAVTTSLSLVYLYTKK
jgi:protein involved in polysaccharide export with SLBB domain